MNRELSNTLSISAYLHCAKCLAERPPDQTPAEWAQLMVGYTRRGLQIWCRRHDVNVSHIDFEGHRHPANMTVVGDV